MKKFFLSLVVFIASAGYVAYQYIGGSPASAAIATTVTPPTTQVAVTTTPVPVKTTPTPTPTPKPAPTPTPTPTPVTKPNGQYADSTYTGSPADAYYGMVQIQAV